MLTESSIPEMLKYLLDFDLFIRRVNEAQALLKWTFQPSNNPMSKKFYAATSNIFAAVTPENPNYKTQVGWVI